MIIAEDTYLHPGYFIHQIKKLEDLDIKNKEQYHNFALKCLKDFIENNFSWMQDAEPKNRPGLQEIFEFDEQLSNYYEQYINIDNQNSTDSIEKIINFHLLFEYLSIQNVDIDH
jgi:hypothetical protein